MSQIHLTIDEQRLVVPEGQTILDVCRAHDIYVPTLCHHPGLSNVGGCRLCIVEVEGQRRPVPACTTPAAEDMVVKTSTSQLQNLRRQTLELLFTERNHICPFCPASGNCELQNAAYRHDMDHVRYDYCCPVLPMDNSHSRIALDHNRCVLCARCVRACDEWIGAHVLDFDRRGFATMLMADNGIPLGQSSCVSCGTCVSVCPTGALFDKRSAHWQGRLPLELSETICPACGVGCRIHASVRHRQIGEISSAGGPNGNHVLCERGRFGLVDPKGPRVAGVRMKQANRWVDKTLPDAISDIVRRLNAPPVQADPSRVIALISPRLPLETIAAAQSFLTRCVGSSRWGLPDRMNHPAIREAMEWNDRPAPLAGLKDLDESDMILLLGCNLERSHGVIASYVRRLVLHRRAKLVKINPRHTWLTHWTDLQLPVQQGKDALVLAAMLKVLMEDGSAKFDVPADLAAKLRRLDDAAISIATGIPAEDIRKAARLYAAAKKPMILCGLGMTRQQPEAMIGAINLAKAMNSKTESGRWRIMELAMGGNSAGSRLLGNTGLDINTLDPHTAEVAFVVLGDDERTWAPAWLAKLRAVSYVVALVAREHPVTEVAQVVIPTASWSERSGTFVNLEGRVQKAHRLMDPAGTVVDEGAFFQDLAQAWRGPECAWAPPGLPPVIAPIGDGHRVPCEPPRPSVNLSGLSALLAE